MRHIDLDSAFGFLVNDVARLLRTEFDRRVRPLGLTRAQCAVLGHVLRSDGMTQTALADELELQPPTLGRLLDRLEDKGWIERRADLADRRAKRVFLTARAEPILETMFGVGMKLRAEALDGLSPVEQQQLLDLLARVKENVLTLRERHCEPAAMRESVDA